MTMDPKAYGRTFVALCSLACLVSCRGSGARGHKDLGAGPSEAAPAGISEISEARLSSDGAYIALCEPPATAQKERGQRIWLFDTNAARVVNASPAGHDSALPDWGKGGSYLMGLEDRQWPVGDRWHLYYAPDPRTAPRSLAGPGREMLSFPRPGVWESCLAEPLVVTS